MISSNTKDYELCLYQLIQSEVNGIRVTHNIELVLTEATLI